jgi:hypothetical protein
MNLVTLWSAAARRRFGIESPEGARLPKRRRAAALQRYPVAYPLPVVCLTMLHCSPKEE